MREVLSTYIYELKKGSKPSCLLTLEEKEAPCAIKKIESSGFSYFCRSSENGFGVKKVNIFFGKKVFIDVLKKIIKKPLNELSAKEDFILGILLGYNIEAQCERFVKKTSKKPIY